MDKITMEERYSDLYSRNDGDMCAILLMYSTGDGEPRFITSGPYRYETAVSKIEAMLNEAEQGRFVCNSSHFISPDRVICIKLDKWKDRKDRRYEDGRFYD